MESYNTFSESSNMTMEEHQQLNGDSVSNGEKVLYDLLFSDKDDNTNESKNGKPSIYDNSLTYFFRFFVF